jgi:protein-disulfide isomerase
MTLRRQGWMVAMGLGLITSMMTGGAGSALAAGFSDAQRAEIVTILRNALKTDPTILQEAIEALRTMEAAREQEVGKAAVASVRDRLITTADQIGGNPNGDVTIVEFFDVRCGYCKRLDPVLTRFIADDRNIRRVYKDLPILGPASVLGAKAVMAARKQNAYERMREALMKGPPDITMASLQADAKRLGLDWERLSRDMEDPAIRAQIDANMALAQAMGIQGTPAMVIGQELIPGAVPLEELRRIVAGVRASKS